MVSFDGLLIALHTFSASDFVCYFIIQPRAIAASPHFLHNPIHSSVHHVPYFRHVSGIKDR